MARPPLNAPPHVSTAHPLERMPPAPRDLTEDEREQWRRIGRPLVEARLLAAPDLVMLAEAARASAMLSRLYRSETARPSTVASWARLVKELLNSLGASPQARRSVPVAAAPSVNPDLQDLIDG